MTSKRQVVFVTPGLHGGGAERVLAIVANNIDQTKFQCSVISLGKQEESRDFTTVVRFHFVNSEGGTKRRPIFRKIFGRIGVVWKLRQLLKELPRDAVLVPFLEHTAVHLWMSVLFTSRSYVIALHTVESNYLRSRYTNGLRRFAEKWLLRRACLKASAILVPSDGVKEDLIRNFGLTPAQIQVVPYPFDIMSITEQAKHVPEIPLPELNGRPLFLYAGRLVEEKNPQLLLQTCRCLLNTTPDFTVVILGSGPLEELINSMIRQEGLTGHVFLLGQVANPFPYMARARGLLLTSHYESFGLVLAEAMICGAVPIAVDCPVGPREVLDHGRSGLLVPIDDPDALAEAMLRIAHDDSLHSQQRAAGAQSVAKYDIHMVIPQWNEVLIQS